MHVQLVSYWFQYDLPAIGTVIGQTCGVETAASKLEQSGCNPLDKILSMITGVFKKQLDHASHEYPDFHLTNVRYIYCRGNRPIIGMRHLDIVETTLSCNIPDITTVHCRYFVRSQIVTAPYTFQNSSRRGTGLRFSRVQFFANPFGGLSGAEDSMNLIDYEFRELTTGSDIFKKIRTLDFGSENSFKCHCCRRQAAMNAVNMLPIFRACLKVHSFSTDSSLITLCIRLDELWVSSDTWRRIWAEMDTGYPKPVLHLTTFSTASLSQVK
ncbi:hypothetical protein CLF_111371, partial [Clonorchis sinensis]